MGFYPTWRYWIPECRSSSSFSVFMNGTSYGFFKPSRGLHQGDPLSPLLFVICTEGFAALIRKAISEGKLEEIKFPPVLLESLTCFLPTTLTYSSGVLYNNVRT
ncbi:unnamed protein product [Linum trigynum]|uniref:Reverse transcriptase domain-containing protein n=1 Tax=Linum trigynum TaxID=586398 RepID=A0AAV2CWZ5_9ROSI